MSFLIPNLLEGKTLSGVLPPEKQPPLQNLLPKHNSQPSAILDIEACIDDPSLAPLGFHVKKKKSDRKQQDTNIKTGQVCIQSKQPASRTSELFSTTNGVLMLRRRGMKTDQLAEELNAVLLPPLTSFLKSISARAVLAQPNIHIVELDISRNRLDQLPPQISQLTFLRTLNATGNLLTEIPKELYSLKQLETLILSQNLINSIPEKLPFHLPNLITFRIAANKIDTITTRLDLWKKMRHLQLGSVYGGNQLDLLPENITEMPLLEELDVSYNKLRTLPDYFNIQSLQILNVSNNRLDFIPKSITHCHQLKSLNISKNHLTSLPADLVNLRHLELFDISENLLCIMPAEILERMQSTTLLITGNPLTRPGNCGQHKSSQDAYSRILHEMSQQGIARSSSSPTVSASSSSSTFTENTIGKLRDQCGPRGMGCLFDSPADNLIINKPTLEELLPFSPKSPSVVCSSPFQDADASIDHELSFHAQQLNINGSRPASPQQEGNLIGTSRSTIMQDYSTSTTSSTSPATAQYTLVDFPRTLPLPTGTKLLHSLKEIATRAILKDEALLSVTPLQHLPAHLEQDVMGGTSKCRACAYCHGPFVHEWVTAVQIKSFGGHPAVVRRVRFCSTKCWYQCLRKEESKSVVSIHK